MMRLLMNETWSKMKAEKNSHNEKRAVRDAMEEWGHMLCANWTLCDDQRLTAVDALAGMDLQATNWWMDCFLYQLALA